MAVLSKADLKTEKDTKFADNTTGDISAQDAREVFEDVVDSYENVIQSLTSVQRDALTPAANDKIFNSTTGRVEIYSGTKWLPAAPPNTNTLDCSANPNFPAGLLGDSYYVTVAGKIGGASGPTVYVGDKIECIAKNDGGDYATVGAYWVIVYTAGDGTGFGQVKMITVAVSNANLKALNGTPKTFGTAPGSGKILIPVYYVWKFTYIAPAFAASTGGPIDMYYTGGTYPIATISDDIGGLTADMFTIGSKFDTVFDSVVANATLELKARNANYDAGGGGRATLQIYLKEHSLP